MGTIINSLVIADAIDEARQIVRVSEARSARRFDREHPGVRAAAQAAEIAAWDEFFAAEEAEAALNEVEMVLTDFSDADEDFCDAETGESLFAGFSVRG